VSLTISGAFKALLESPALNLHLAVYAAAPPSGVKPPSQPPYAAYLVVFEGIGMKMDPLEDGGPAGGAAATARDLAQLDLWQCWRLGDRPKEVPGLQDAITRAVHGSRLVFGAPAKQAYGVVQRNRFWKLERDANLTHWIFDLALAREV
jgi:hypothetical protein